jgi:uncharacterized protein YoxC
MNELVHADIFFFITAVAVMLITSVLVVALVYVIYILRDVRAIVARMRRASESIESDLTILRQEVMQENMKARALVAVVLGFITRKLSGAIKKKRAAK